MSTVTTTPFIPFMEQALQKPYTGDDSMFELMQFVNQPLAEYEAILDAEPDQNQLLCDPAKRRELALYMTYIEEMNKYMQEAVNAFHVIGRNILTVADFQRLTEKLKDGTVELTSITR